MKLSETAKKPKEINIRLSSEEAKRLRALLLEADNEALNEICYGTRGEQIRSATHDHVFYQRILSKLKGAKRI